MEETKENVTRSDKLLKGLVLDISLKFEINATSLTKLTRSQILFSSDKKTRKTNRIDRTIYPKNDQPMHRQQKAYAFLDDKIVAKMIFLVDERFHQWLCFVDDVQYISDRNTHQMNVLRSSFKDMLFNRFSYTLPPNI